MSNPVEIPFSVWRKIAMASWRERKDPMIAATLDVDAGPVLDYIEQVRRATGVHMTPAHLVGRAAAKVVEALPGLNGRVVFGSFAPSPTIDGFFVVSLRTDPVDGKLLVQTDAASGKVKRIRRNPQVRVAVCTASGRLRGKQVPAGAEILPRSEVGAVERLIADKYRFDMIIFRPLRFIQARLHLGRPRTEPAVLAITPS